MGRCPKYLDVAGFESLASSMDIKLSDDGISSLGEITEFIATQILRHASNIDSEKPVGIEAVLLAAKRLNIKVMLSSSGKTVLGAEI